MFAVNKQASAKVLIGKELEERENERGREKEIERVRWSIQKLEGGFLLS